MLSRSSAPCATEVKQLPSNWVAEQDDPDRALQPQWPLDLSWLH